VVVFLFPRTPPNLSMIRPLGRNLQVRNYRLHLRVLTDYEVIRQFYSPLSTSVEPNSPPQSRFSYGGGGGNRTLVLPVIRFVSTNCILFIPKTYSIVKRFYSIIKINQLSVLNVLFCNLFFRLSMICNGMMVVD